MTAPPPPPHTHTLEAHLKFHRGEAVYAVLRINVRLVTPRGRGRRAQQLLLLLGERVLKPTRSVSRPALVLPAGVGSQAPRISQIRWRQARISQTATAQSLFGQAGQIDCPYEHGDE